MTRATDIDRTTRPAAGPVTGADRINSLDTIRGVAVLGILPMNALAFGLDQAAYVNVSADGIGQPLDWVIGVLTMVFIDQKMMALFSLLFGVPLRPVRVGMALCHLPRPPTPPHVMRCCESPSIPAPPQRRGLTTWTAHVSAHLLTSYLVRL